VMSGRAMRGEIADSAETAVSRATLRARWGRGGSGATEDTAGFARVSAPTVT